MGSAKVYIYPHTSKFVPVCVLCAYVGPEKMQKEILSKKEGEDEEEAERKDG